MSDGDKDAYELLPDQFQGFELPQGRQPEASPADVSTATPDPCLEEDWCAVVTRESLRGELQFFTENTLRPCLQELVPAIAQAMKKELQKGQDPTLGGRAPLVSCADEHVIQNQPEPQSHSWPVARGGPVQAPAPDVRKQFQRELQKHRASDKESLLDAVAENTVEDLDTSRASRRKGFGDMEDEEAGGESVRMQRISMRRSASIRRASVESTVSIGEIAAALTCQERVHAFVERPAFEHVVMVLIGLNAVLIAAEIDYSAKNPEMEDTGDAWMLIDFVFVFLFAVELALRVIAYRCEFFHYTLKDGQRNPSWHWNVLDFFLINLQVFACLRQMQQRNKSALMDFFSVGRLFRLLRLVRVLKVFRWVHELRVIVLSIARSFRIFVWSFVALHMITFFFACYFTEVVRNFRSSGTTEIDVGLEKAFGSIPRTMLSLFQAVSGGMDWGDLSTLLQYNTYLVFCGLLPLVMYVSFTLLALMNVITGVFLETAIDKAKEEKEVLLASHAARVFRKADKTNTGRITWKDFERAMKFRSVQQFFEAIDVDHSQARDLFQLLDFSGDGEISAEEFLQGCMNFCGPAKSLDLLVLTRRVQKLFERHMSMPLGGCGLAGGASGEQLLQSRS